MTTTLSWAQTAGPMDVQPELEYVGFWARVAAALVDTVILFIVVLPLTYVFYGRFSSASGQMFQGPMDVVINVVLPAVAIIWLWRRFQATPGKLAMGARIADANTGEPPTWKQSVIRYLGYYVSLIPLGIGMIWVGLDRRKQGWHDKMANTVVVRPAGKEAVRFQSAKKSGERFEPSA